MSRYDDLKKNIDEIVSVVSSAQAELKVAEKEFNVLDLKKTGIIKDIDDLEKDLLSI